MFVMIVVLLNWGIIVLYVNLVKLNEEKPSNIIGINNIQRNYTNIISMRKISDKIW